MVPVLGWSTESVMVMVGGLFLIMVHNKPLLLSMATSCTQFSSAPYQRKVNFLTAYVFVYERSVISLM